MAVPAGESNDGGLRLDFDRRVKLEFHGSKVTSDAGLLPYRELDDALGLMAIAESHLADGRSGKNGRHALVGMLRQSVFGRLAGYDDVNDADRLGLDPAMRWRADHPLRPIRAIVNAALERLSPEFAALYAGVGRPSNRTDQCWKKLQMAVSACPVGTPIAGWAFLQVGLI